VGEPGVPPRETRVEACQSARAIIDRPAEVAELADAPDSKSGGTQVPCGFDSHLRHHCQFRVAGGIPGSPKTPSTGPFADRRLPPSGSTPTFGTSDQFSLAAEGASTFTSCPSGTARFLFPTNRFEPNLERE
jgi:hypothetical protein